MLYRAHIEGTSIIYTGLQLAFKALGCVKRKTSVDGIYQGNSIISSVYASYPPISYVCLSSGSLIQKNANSATPSAGSPFEEWGQILGLRFVHCEPYIAGVDNNHRRGSGGVVRGVCDLGLLIRRLLHSITSHHKVRFLINYKNHKINQVRVGDLIVHLELQ